MTGPEHYHAAAQLVQLAEHHYAGSDTTDPHPQWTLTIQQAQVHATLALAAATASPNAADPAWIEATS